MGAKIIRTGHQWKARSGSADCADISIGNSVEILALFAPWRPRNRFHVSGV